MVKVECRRVVPALFAVFGFRAMVELNAFFAHLPGRSQNRVRGSMSRVSFLIVLFTITMKCDGSVVVAQSEETGAVKPCQVTELSPLARVRSKHLTERGWELAAEVLGLSEGDFCNISFSEFVSRLVAARNYSEADAGTLLFCYGNSQGYSVTSRDVAKLFSAQRESIRNCDIRFVVTTSEGEDLGNLAHPMPGVNPIQEECHFAFGGRSVLFKRKRRGPVDPDSGTPSLEAFYYDGRVFRYVQQFGAGRPNCSVRTLGAPSDLDQLYYPGNPMVMAGLLVPGIDYRTDFPFGIGSFSEVAAHVPLLKITEEVDGHPCVSIARFDEQYLCDPQIGFAVRRYKTLAEYDPSEQALVYRKAGLRLDNFDFRQYADGIWLPASSKYEAFSEAGKITKRIESSIVDASFPVQDPMPELLQGLFPQGCLLIDAIENTRTIIGREDVTGAPQDAISLPEASSSSTGTWIILVNAVVILGLVILFALRRHKNA